MDQHSSVYTVIFSYMQPFELATVSDTHTLASYLNAAEQDSIEYLLNYKHLCMDFDIVMHAAASAGALNAISLLVDDIGTVNIGMKNAIYAAANADHVDAVRLLISLSEININDIFVKAIPVEQFKTMRILTQLGNINLNEALFYAVALGCDNAVRLIVELGASNLDHAIEIARSYAQFNMIALIAELKVKNQLC